MNTEKKKLFSIQLTAQESKDFDEVREYRGQVTKAGLFRYMLAREKKRIKKA